MNTLMLIQSNLNKWDYLNSIKWMQIVNKLCHGFYLCIYFWVQKSDLIHCCMTDKYDHIVSLLKPCNPNAWKFDMQFKCINLKYFLKQFRFVISVSVDTDSSL